MDIIKRILFFIYLPSFVLLPLIWICLGPKRTYGLYNKIGKWLETS